MFIGSFYRHDRVFYYFHFAFPGMDRYKRRAVLLPVIRAVPTVGASHIVNQRIVNHRRVPATAEADRDYLTVFLMVFRDSLTAHHAASVEVIGLMIRCLLSELRPLRFSSDAIASLTQSFLPFARSCLSRSATQDSRAG
ncbi:hypothetical protein QUF31_07470 [Dickeya chrysanthemi]|uniref:hypothetical protein n=1 Tax=Dickeya chrysanthemi TaxID=556 RepID=UPI0025A08E2A|nr:hypothetical protein [Dickeya chrysanthemi]WJM86926.1 hypothetical protein QUF31_07470 [Dickeya chrysanthemi]